MGLHEHRIFQPRFLAGWASFTIAAGFVNAAAFMASNRVVSHVTGNVTAVATQSSLAFHVAAIVFAFITGGMVAVLATEKLKERPLLAYSLPPLGACAVLVVIAVAGRVGAFGEFGEENDVTGSVFPMLTFLALSMGMLNASVAAATSNRIRVTHMTGPATDLAGHVVRGVLRSGEESRTELRWAWLRLGKLLCFVVGGVFAANVSDRVEWHVFLIGAMLLLLAVGLTGTPAALVERCGGGAPSGRHATAR